MTKKLNLTFIILITLILIVNLFYINTLKSDIKELTNWVEAVSDRQLRSGDYLYELKLKVDLLNTQVEAHKIWLDTDYDNIKFLTDEMSYVKTQLDVLMSYDYWLEAQINELK